MGIMLMVTTCGAFGVFAEDPTYSITVTNNNEATSIAGKTFTAHKLFDVTYSGTNYSYSIKKDNPFYTSAKSVLDTYFVFTATSDANVETVTVKESKIDSITKTLSADDARDLADALQAYIPSSGGTSAQATTESVTISLAEAGYYVVTGSVKPSSPADSTQEIISSVILDNATPTATVNPKVSIPSLDKKITGEHKLDDAGTAAAAKVGSTVSFELDSKVPDLTGYSSYTFEIHDTMSSGLTFTIPQDVVVKIKDADKTNNVTINISGQNLTVTIPYNVLNAAAKDDPIVVTYSAVLNANALNTDYEKNTAFLRYSNSPYENTTNDTPETEVYVIDVNVDVLKTATTADGNPLKDAQFKLFRGTSTPADSATDWYHYDETNGKVEWVAKANADTFITGDNGKFNPQVRGLEAEKTGTAYGLLEIAAPKGYNLLKDPVLFTLTGAVDKTQKKATITASAGTVSGGTIDLSNTPAAQPVVTENVINNTGAALPSTGGMGTTMIYIIGAILLVGAGILLITKKRMSAE